MRRCGPAFRSIKTPTRFTPLPETPGRISRPTAAKGKNLYSDSVVALDISGATPKLKWYYKVSPNDVHDNDPSMPPVLFTGNVGGANRQLLAVGDKAGDFVILTARPASWSAVIAVSNQQGIFTTVPTVAGTFACPNHGGGIEWNGGSYDAATNYFVIPEHARVRACGRSFTPERCRTSRASRIRPARYRNARTATGVVTAVDVSTGKPAWGKQVAVFGAGRRARHE